MARLPRSTLPEHGIFHVTSKCAGGIPIAADDDDRRDWMRLRSDVERSFGWRTIVFILMGNHFHLVVETDRGPLSAGIQRLCGV